jgi:hypothetical protein
MHREYGAWQMVSWHGCQLGWSRKGHSLMGTDLFGLRSTSSFSRTTPSQVRNSCEAGPARWRLLEPAPANDHRPHRQRRKSAAALWWRLTRDGQVRLRVLTVNRPQLLVSAPFPGSGNEET